MDGIEVTHRILNEAREAGFKATVSFDPCNGQPMWMITIEGDTIPVFSFEEARDAIENWDDYCEWILTYRGGVVSEEDICFICQRVIPPWAEGRVQIDFYERNAIAPQQINMICGECRNTPQAMMVFGWIRVMLERSRSEVYNNVPTLEEMLATIISPRELLLASIIAQPEQPRVRVYPI